MVTLAEKDLARERLEQFLATHDERQTRLFIFPPKKAIFDNPFGD